MDDYVFTNIPQSASSVLTSKTIEDFYKHVAQQTGIPKELFTEKPKPIPRRVVKRKAEIQWAQASVRKRMHKWVRWLMPSGQKVLVIDDPVGGKYIVMSPDQKRMLMEIYDKSPLSVLHDQNLRFNTFEGIPIIEDRHGILKDL